MRHEQDQRFLQQCVDRATASVAEGGGPFAAAVVRGNELLALACNRVTADCDPTAHAEIEAIRHAALRTGDPRLSGCVLYASCEPCPMCLAAAMWARVERIVYAAPHTEAVRAGFDDTVIAQRLYGRARPVRVDAGYLQHCEVPGAAAPFDAWLAKTDRIEY